MKWMVFYKTEEGKVAYDYGDDVRFYPNWVTLVDELGQPFRHLNVNTVIEVRKEKI